MDILLSSNTDKSTGLPTWDFSLRKGVVQTIEKTAETKQRAVLASFLQVGTIPQLPNTGNPWLGVVLGEKNLLDADATVRSNIQNLAGTFSHVPVYSTSGNKLVCTIEEA